MVAVNLQTLVEPFKEGEPGAHVQSVVDTLNAAGVSAEMGPFATTSSGDVDVIADAVASAIRAAFANGATAVQFRVEAADE